MKWISPGGNACACALRGAIAIAATPMVRTDSKFLKRIGRLPVSGNCLPDGKRTQQAMPAARELFRYMRVELFTTTEGQFVARNNVIMLALGALIVAVAVLGYQLYQER